MKYPEITVKLSGCDGNAVMIMAKVRTALRKAGVTERERDKYQEEATSGDYDDLLQTTMKWVNVT
jgi:hypothetical protein